MSNIAIQVEGLSKRYHIGGKQESYKTLRDTLTNAFVSPFRRAGKLLRGQATGAAESDETIWALKDVSFEIKRGEVVGIIGRNGAGKSTLLKILSRITEPTNGFAEIYGRVGSLLEVGTGFHPELTGRENIYLNGAILGMKRAEIDRKFDEIVEFAEIEKFIDTPVKHYSSGMYLRLAFAVAAHFEPEILLVDEVLAVGDAAFQKKCLGKMESLSSLGRTILMVSHNLPTIQALCSRAIVVHQGRLVRDTSSHDAVRYYLDDIRAKAANIPLDKRDDRKGTGAIKFHHVEVADSQSENGAIYTGNDISITMAFKTYRRVPNCNFGLHIQNSLGQIIYRITTRDTIGSILSIDHDGCISCKIAQPRLLPGTYEVKIFASSMGENLDEVFVATRFEVLPADIYGTGNTPQNGIVYAIPEWRLNGKEIRQSGAKPLPVKRSRDVRCMCG